MTNHDLPLQASFHPGELVMVDIQGQRLDEATAQFLRQHHIRGVCLFRKNLGTEDEVRQLTRDLREVMGPRALIALDQEGGSVVRATFLPQAPSAMALGAAGDETQAFAVGAAVARGLRSIGINWNFAPVLDVNNNPANPVIAERSFSENPHEVTRLARAWMKGSLSEGVACCVKHFPGHGDTHVDSHLALPTVDKSRAQLDELELIPFKALAGEAPAMMTAHIVYPQIDPEHPATLSRRILGDTLRDEWGYGGVVITDALMMKAIFDRYGYARSSELAISAGADMILAQGSLEEQGKALAALEAAFAEGRLTLEQGLKAKARLDAFAHQYPVRHDDYAGPQRELDDQLMRQAWASGLSTLRGAVPPARDAQLLVLVQPDVPTDGVSEAGLHGSRIQALFSGFPNAEVRFVDDILNLDPSALRADGRPVVLVSTHRMRYPQAARDWPVSLHLSVWNPFQALDLPVPTVVTWGYADGAMAGLEAWLHGRHGGSAQSPVNLG